MTLSGKMSLLTASYQDSLCNLTFLVLLLVSMELPQDTPLYISVLNSWHNAKSTYSTKSSGTTSLFTLSSSSTAARSLASSALSCSSEVVTGKRSCCLRNASKTVNDMKQIIKANYICALPLIHKYFCKYIQKNEHWRLIHITHMLWY